MTFIINVLANLASWMNGRWAPMSVVFAAALVLYTNILGIIDAARSAIDMLDGLAGAGNSLGIQDPANVAGTFDGVAIFSVANYLLPIDLAIAMFTIWLPVAMAATFIRVVKSWIPTLS